MVQPPPRAGQPQRGVAGLHVAGECAGCSEACCTGLLGVRVDGDVCKMVQPVPWTPTPAAPAPWAALSSWRSSAWDHSHSPCCPIHHLHAVCQPHKHIAPRALTLAAP